MKRIIAYSIIALLQVSVSLAQTSSKPKLQKREKYEWQGEIPTFIEYYAWDEDEDGPIPGIKLFKDFNIYLALENKR